MEKATNYTITNVNQFPAIDLEEVESEFFGMLHGYREEYLEKMIPELTLTENSVLCRDKSMDTMLFETFLSDAYEDNGRAIREKFTKEVNEAIETDEKTCVRVWLHAEGLDITSYEIDTMYGVQNEHGHGDKIWMDAPESDGQICIDFSEVTRAEVTYDEEENREWEFFFGKTGITVTVTIWK